LPIEPRALRDAFPESDELDVRKQDLIREFVAVCKSQGITLIFVTPPAYHPNGLLTVVERAARDSISRIAQEGNVPYIVMSQDSVEDFRNPGMFYDVLHLNRKGTHVFTAILCQKLERILKSINDCGQ
jgi:hypothetical protein